MKDELIETPFKNISSSVNQLSGNVGGSRGFFIRRFWSSLAFEREFALKISPLAYKNLQISSVQINFAVVESF